VGKAIGKGAKKAKGWMAADYQTRTARANSARREQAIRDAVKKKVKENAAVKKEFLEQFEAKFDVKLTKMEDGELVIDRDAVKLLGERKTLDLMQSETGAVINLPSNALTAPILNAETFDSLIGTLIDLKQVAPEEFGKGATLIDDMLRVTIEGKVKPEKMDQPVKSGTIETSSGSARIEGVTMNVPGFLRCWVTVKIDGFEYRGIATAGFSPEEIKPTVPNPEDFVDFWETAKNCGYEIDEENPGVDVYRIHVYIIKTSDSAKGLA